MDVWTEDGCRLWTAATGQGKPLVMCHGGPGLWDMAGSLATRLAGNSRVVRWDQRGCGRSERRGPYSVARCVADLDAVRGTAGLERTALFGHCWGATLGPAVYRGGRVLACALISDPAASVRTVAGSAAAVAQRVNNHTVLVSVLEDDAARAVRRLGVLCAQARS